ncbi:MAG: F0F1 ATP synthase subunit B [Rhodospirillales bacterium]|nr:F0F1 ATP synthase subunit B [Rhodospirillales bacterium]
MEFLHDTHFWEAVAFVIAVALVWKKASSAITGALDERARKIREELDEARKLREEAQATLANYQRKQRDALKEAEEIIAHAKAEAERLGAQAAHDLEAAIQRRQRLAEEKIAQAEQKALAEVRAAAVDIAVAAARRVLAEEMGARGSKLIDEAIDSLPQRLH